MLDAPAQQMSSQSATSSDDSIGSSSSSAAYASRDPSIIDAAAGQASSPDQAADATQDSHGAHAGAATFAISPQGSDIAAATEAPLREDSAPDEDTVTVDATRHANKVQVPSMWMVCLICDRCIKDVLLPDSMVCPWAACVSLPRKAR